MTMTLWVDTLSGERLDRNALAAVQERARRTYETNPHIFEDALDALTAFGVVALHRGGVRGRRVAARLCGHEPLVRPASGPRHRRSRLARRGRRLFVGP